MREKPQVPSALSASPPSRQIFGAVLQAGDLVALHKIHDQEALRGQARHGARHLHRPRQALRMRDMRHEFS